MSRLKEYYRETPSLRGSDGEKKRQEILDYFVTTYELYEKLFEPLAAPHAFYKDPDAQRHPVVFYYGHTATFFINKLIVAQEIESRINPEFESMFAIGVDEMSWDDMDSSHYEWPSVQATKNYRDEVKELVIELIKSRPIVLPITWDDRFWWTILMGIEHERIHLETSSVLHRQLEISDVKASSFWPIANDAKQSFPDNGLVEIGAKTLKLGKHRDADYYGWDNEYGDETVEVKAFQAAKYLTSNGEFLEFVKERGYETQRYWSEEGWTWLGQDKRNYPKFWIKRDDGAFEYRTMLEIIRLPLNWPVEVNYHEAKAFCNYKSAREGGFFRLPTEPEWYAICEQEGIGEKFQQGNIALREYASSVAVDKHRFNKLYDVVGNVWQWTESYIYAYEGFAAHPIYDDFSVPTFDNKHNLIKGGSWISTGNETLLKSRYAFRRHFMQHAGFRYIQGEKEMKIKEVNSYESDIQVSQYCDFHYGETHFGVENFSKSLVEIGLRHLPAQRYHKALDLGCAVGRASFELANYFHEVTGVDFSARFIQAGTHLKEGGSISYRRQVEGDIFRVEHVDLESFDFANNAAKVEFIQGDACNLKIHLTGYDLVIAANLIDRLYEPKLFLESIKTRIKSGGILVISSPYTWLEEFTHKDHWLGGTVKEGIELTTYEALQNELSDSFDEVCTPYDLPFVIRETARKFQHTVAHVTVWKRR